MNEPNLRHAARALLLDETDAVLLCRFDLREAGGPVVWAAPGGGMDPGETELDVFSPRAFGVHLSALLRDGLPDKPLDLPHVE